MPLPNVGDDPWYVAKFVVSVLETAGVLAAVIIVLWDKLKGIIVKPKLVVGFYNPDRPLEEAPMLKHAEGEQKIPAQFVATMKVTNCGYTTATGCELHLLDLEKKVGDSFVSIKEKYRMKEMPWRDFRASTVSIHRNLHDSLRVVCISEDRKSKPKEAGGPPTTSGLLLEIPPLVDVEEQETARLKMGEYRISLLAVTNNRVETRFVFGVKNSGAWKDRLKVLEDAGTAVWGPLP